MATHAGAGRQKLPERQQKERRFYLRMALLIMAVIFIGFAPSFYLKPFNVVHFPRPNPDLNGHLMLHGLVFSLWTVIFLVQTLLISAGRRDLHKKLGIFGFTLAIAMIPIMYLTTLDEIARNSGPPWTDVLTWAAVPLVPIPFYMFVLWKGWNARRTDLASHKRIMLGLMIMLTQPATARLPLLPPMLWTFAALSALGMLLFVPMARWDKQTLGHIHPATKMGAGIYALIIVVQIACMAVPEVWKSFIVMLPGIAA